jgi:hypothetical protein
VNRPSPWRAVEARDRSKCQHAIEVIGDRGICAQRLELAHDDLKRRHGDDGGPRYACSLPAPRHMEPLEDVESAQVAGFAQRTIKRRNVGGVKKSIVGRS